MLYNSVVILLRLKPCLFGSYHACRQSELLLNALIIIIYKSISIAFAPFPFAPFAPFPTPLGILCIEVHLAPRHRTPLNNEF